VISVNQPAGADQRLYGMMQHLMSAYAHQQATEKPDLRGVVELQDALDAAIQLAAVVDEETQTGRIPVDRASTPQRCSCSFVSTSSHYRAAWTPTASPTT
jgi:hypothetical protein